MGSALVGFHVPGCSTGWQVTPSNGERPPSSASPNWGVLVRMEQSGFTPDEEANYRGASHGWKRYLGGLENVVAGLR
jgi:hypothetical protein